MPENVWIISPNRTIPSGGVLIYYILSIFIFSALGRAPVLMYPKLQILNELNDNQTPEEPDARGASTVLPNSAVGITTLTDGGNRPNKEYRDG